VRLASGVVVPDELRFDVQLFAAFSKETDELCRQERQGETLAFFFFFCGGGRPHWPPRRRTRSCAFVFLLLASAKASVITTAGRWNRAGAPAEWKSPQQSMMSLEKKRMRERERERGRERKREEERGRERKREEERTRETEETDKDGWRGEERRE